MSQQMPAGFTILAIETSCDETAAAVIRDGREIVANSVASQIDIHQRYGGVVPEVASRQHILTITPVINTVLAQVPGGWSAINAVATTYGPGLAGALLTGINTAKAIAWSRNLPFIGVNHLEGHIYASWLHTAKDLAYQAPEFPCVALIVSGGHTALVLLNDHGDYRLLGQTLLDQSEHDPRTLTRVQRGQLIGPCRTEHVEMVLLLPPDTPIYNKRSRAMTSHAHIKSGLLVAVQFFVLPFGGQR